MSPTHSGPPDPGYMSLNDADRTRGVIPWFCTKISSFIIGNQEVYQGRDHVTLGYSYFLEGVLAQALDLPMIPKHT